MDANTTGSSNDAGRRGAALRGGGLMMVAALVGSCAASVARAPSVTHAPDPSLPQCGGGPPAPCLTAPSCQYDESYRCQICVCSPAWQTKAQAEVAPLTSP